MNLHFLRLFVAVARHRSFSRAAEALHISQPAVSKGIRELEAELGSPLLERKPGGASLTEAGRILLRHAQDLFAAERSAEEELAALRGLHRGTLRLGASTTVATYLLPPLLGAFSREHPAIELRLTSANTRTIAELLTSRDLDVALVEGPVAGPDILVEPWRTDELVFVAAAGHALAAARAPLPVQALAGETLVLREPGSGTREVAQRALDGAGFAPARILEVSGNEAITRVVAAGLGIGIVSSAVVADPVALGRLSRLHVEGLTIQRPLTRLSLPNRSLGPAAAAFNRMLDEAPARA